MAQRPELQSLLIDILESNHVYFQPPENVVMEYPCIVYNRDNILADWADNYGYKLNTRYSVTVIDRDPDNEAIKKLAQLPYCTYERFYVADNLNHDVFRLFF